MDARLGLLAAVALALCGCGSIFPTRPILSSGPDGGVSAPTTTPLGTVSVAGAASTGISPSFQLAGGSYVVDWVAVPNVAGCYFSLVLATTPNAQTVKEAGNTVLGTSVNEDKTLWTEVPAGTYVLREARSGQGDCAGTWSATMYPQPNGSDAAPASHLGSLEGTITPRRPVPGTRRPANRS